MTEVKSQPLTDEEWDHLDDLCVELGVGAGDPPGGWFQIPTDQIRALESVLDRLECEDDRTDRITKLEKVVDAAIAHVVTLNMPGHLAHVQPMRTRTLSELVKIVNEVWLG